MGVRPCAMRSSIEPTINGGRSKLAFLAESRLRPSLNGPSHAGRHSSEIGTFLPRHNGPDGCGDFAPCLDRSVSTILPRRAKPVPRLAVDLVGGLRTRARSAASC